MKLYPNERKAIRLITKLQDEGRNKFTIDEFTKRFYENTKKRPSWRRNTIAMLNRIGQKLDEENGACRLIRSSGIGRGAIATYSARGYFGQIEV